MRVIRVRPLYVYAAVVERVIDGDTVELSVDLGFYVMVREACRISGINAREMDQPGGEEAAEHLSELLPFGRDVVINSIKRDKYGGRFDAQIRLLDGTNIADRMVLDGYAALWDGTGTAPVPPWPILQGSGATP